jgi:hypothetical protein
LGHRVFDELCDRMLWSPVEALLRLIPQQRCAGHRREGSIKAIQSLEIRSAAVYLGGEDRAQVAPQGCQLRLTIRQQSRFIGNELVADEPFGGFLRTAYFVHTVPARKRDGAVSQGETRMLLGSRGGWKGDL